MLISQQAAVMCCCSLGLPVSERAESSSRAKKGLLKGQQTEWNGDNFMQIGLEQQIQLG